MIDLIKFWDANAAFDKKRYWLLKTTDNSSLVYEIEWRKDSQPLPWYYRTKGEIYWAQTSSENFVFIMERSFVDLKSFKQELYTSLIQQGVHADSVLQKIEDFVGKDVLDEAIKAHKKFLKELVSVVNELCKTTPIAPQPAVNVPKQRHLTLIKKDR